jgi:Poly (ADP-ribose) glycohydrolase (PARG)
MESPILCRRLLVPAVALGSAVAVFAAMTCFGPPGRSLADPDPGLSTAGFLIPFPDALKQEIKGLKDKADVEPDKSKKDKLVKKAWILDAALTDLLPQPFTSNSSLYGLNSLKDYQFNLSKAFGDPEFYPKYYASPFKNNVVTVKKEAAGHYNYAGDEVWVDFANYELGGGVFGNGMMQEETMALTMPQLANAAANHYHTRSQGHAGVLGSNPDPIVLTNVQRSIELDKGLYKDGWLPMTLDEIKKATHPQTPTNQRLTVLAMAVEKVAKKWEEQSDIKTLDDLFNTFVAGFTLAKNINPNVIINTGPIGTGDFDNDPKVIYVMQNLAAQQVGGITLRYWGYYPDNYAEQKGYEPMVNQIIDKWKKDPDKKVGNLLLIAYGCLTGKPSG